MNRRVKEFIEIGEHSSLDDLIARLIDVRDSLPEQAEAELRLRGDDVFGRKLCVSYFRAQTEEEAECEARYAAEQREAKERELSRLQEELGVVCYAASGRRSKLRIVG